MAAAAVGAVLLARAEPAPSPPDPASARSAEQRAEARLISLRDDDAAAVRCPRRIEPRMTVRCSLLYPSGGVQLVLVTLSRSGELEVDVP